jgi:hypothetical protein
MDPEIPLPSLCIVPTETTAITRSLRVVMLCKEKSLFFNELISFTAFRMTGN